MSENRRTNPTPGAVEQPAPDAELGRALSVLRGLQQGEVEAGVVPARLAGLETSVVVLQVPGGLVPVFAYLNENLLPLLRDHLGELPAPVDGRPSLLVS